METVAQIWLRIRACADADTPHRLTVLDRSDCRLLLEDTPEVRRRLQAYVDGDQPAAKDKGTGWGGMHDPLTRWRDWGRN